MSVSLPASLGSNAQRWVERLGDALARVDGVEAVALGGSHARGRAVPDSDVDLAVYYRDATPLDLAALRSLAAGWNDTPDPVVTTPYEWGPWVNGGAWLTIDGQRVDWLYRSLDHVERVHTDAYAGRYESHWSQQPPFGFFGPTYLGEVAIAVPLADPRGALAALKERTAGYPEALRSAVVADQLWNVEFGLTAFAGKFAARGDVYLTVASLARFVHQLGLALFALNHRYPINDKTVLDEIDDFANAPERFGARVASILAHPGANAERLEETVEEVREMWSETVELAGDLYSTRRLPDP